jgi:O-antigen/teichoic acid export membrane protein
LNKPEKIEPSDTDTLTAKSKSAWSISFGSDVMKLLGGTTIAQGLIILSAPILARLYDPTAFGVLSVFTSTIAIVTVICCLRYEWAIVIADSNEEAWNLVIVCIVISTAIAAATIPIVALGGTGLGDILNVPELGAILWLLPPAIFFGGITMGHPALNFWTIRTRNFGWLSFARIVGGVLTVGLQLIVGLVGFATGGNLVLASVFGGGIASTVVLGWEIWKHGGKHNMQWARWEQISRVIRRYYKFPLFDSWGALMNIVSWQLPTLLLASFFSPAVAGFYAIGFTLLRSPMSLIDASFSQVFYHRAAEARMQDKLAPLVEVTFSYLVKLCLFPLLMLSIIGRDLIMVVLGNKWAEAGVYAQILSVWAFFWFIFSPLSNVFRVLEKQEYGVVMNIVIIVTRAISLVIGGLMGSPRLALYLFGGSGVLVYGYLLIAIMTMSGVSLTRLLRIILGNALVFLPCGAVLLLMLLLGAKSLMLVGVSIVMLAAYFAFSIGHDPKARGFISEVWRSRANQ